MTRWVLFDDPSSWRLRPFTWLRPASEILLGAETTEQRWRRCAGTDEVEVVCRAALAPLAAGRRTFASELRRLQTSALSTEASKKEVWVSDLVLPDPALLERLRALPPDRVVRSAGAVIGFQTGARMRQLLAGAAERSLHEGEVSSGRDQEVLGRGVLDELDRAGFEAEEIPVTRLEGLGDLIRHQELCVVADLERILAETGPRERIGEGFAYRAESIRLGDGCEVEHGAVLDAREGPIILGTGCRVRPHTWIQGPVFAAAGCSFTGGRIGGGSSFGPRCRVHGEVEASVFLGFDNKAHDGFVGHSVLGEWVNLGAMTTTSDLKNNYSYVTLERPDGREPTSLRKVGVFFGDHVKTRIGCLLTCGTIIGVGANLIGEPAVAEKYVADFSWGTGPGAREYEINKFLGTAEIVSGRRGIPWTPEMAEALRDTFVATQQLRRGQALDRVGMPAQDGGS